jgi:predicted peptidase
MRTLGTTLLALSLLPGLVLVVSTVRAQDCSCTTQAGFLLRTVEVNGQKHRYQVYVPAEYTPDRKWPVILFLHGAGERGTDGFKPTAVGIGQAVRLNPERFSAIIVFPQVPPGRAWFGEQAKVAMAALDAVMATYSVDPDRVYLTGLSMGGHGTWYVAYQWPDRFAAIVPICGFIVFPETSRSFFGELPPEQQEIQSAEDPYRKVAERIKHLPIWVFHGADDPVVPVEASRRMVEALKALGAQVQYTEYNGVGHNAWDPAYAEAELIPWLLAHQRSKE